MTTIYVLTAGECSDYRIVALYSTLELAQAATILKQFSDGISTVGDVAMKELPVIAQQYVTYGFVKGIFGVTISGAFLIAMICTMVWVVKEF